VSTTDASDFAPQPSLGRGAHAPSAAALDVSGLIDGRPIGGYQLLVIALCAGVLFLDGFDTQVIGYIAPMIAKQWHLPRSDLGPLFSMGLTGLMAGFLLFAPLSDRFGHRWTVIACTALFGVVTLLTVTAHDLTQLAVFRFLTGLGLGGATPSAVALTGEYAPKRLRATFVLVIYCGFSLGFVAAGAVAAALLPRFGWRAMLWTGAAAPLLLSLALVAALPESLDFLIVRKAATARVAAILRRIAPELRLPGSLRFTVAGEASRRVPIAELFARGRAPGTFLIWLAFFMNLGMFYFLQSWLPTILSDAGHPIDTVALATALTTTGGIVAAFVVGPLMDRRNPYVAVAALFLAGSVLVALFGATYRASGAALLATAFCAGFCVSGGQKSGIALSALFYPAPMRSTGVGWALGISRVGGIMGPMLAGWLLARHWPPENIFFASAGPMLVAGFAVLVMGRLYRGGSGRAGRS
jgi:AAHS family 4-hydroxybenzoate transporter-like MFS transporter